MTRPPSPLALLSCGSARSLILAATAAVAGAAVGCAPIAPPPIGDAPRHQRGIDAGARLLTFHGRADQMGDLAEIAATYRVIAVDADPANEKFSRQDLAALRAGGRNIVLGFLNVGFCDRSQTYWSSAPDGLLPCVANQAAQIGERTGRPQQVWMGVDDREFQLLIEEYEAPQLEKAGVDGFLVDGLELLDHTPDDPEAPCDEDCVAGGIALLATLRRNYPDMVIVIEGGLSWKVRGARVGETSTRVVSLVDGVVGEEVYTPTYDPQKEADLIAWKAMASTLRSRPPAVFTQDYVNSCKNAAWARMVYRASASHGFSPAIGPSPVSRGPVCHWSGLQ